MHHDIEVLKDLVKEGYSPREGANCIRTKFYDEKRDCPVTVPVRVRIASSIKTLQKRENYSYSPREGANCISKRIQFV